MNAPVHPNAATGGVRVWLRAEGLLVLVLSMTIYGWLGSHWWLFAVLFFAPDLSLLGYLAGPKIGAAIYNIVHSYVLPLFLAAGAITGGRMDIAALCCVWTAHIGFDRMLGYGLKYPTAFGMTHLGRIGKAKG